MTNRLLSEKTYRRATAATVAFMAIILACGELPEDAGEIVIRAGDLVAVVSDSAARQTTDSTITLPLDTVSADSLLLPPDTLLLQDSLPTDSLVMPEDSLLTDTTEVDGLAPTPECPWNVAAVEVNGSIYSSVQGLCDEPDILAAHVVRCMWWNTDPWRGMNAGDSLHLVFGDQGVEGRENRIVALRYTPRAGTVNTAFSVYTFLRTGDNYASHYYADGTEMMKLLDVMPITTFEEMTGPCGEPRGGHDHAGVDFKAPEGTPVRTCRGGTVSRVNWNPEYNGNCVEINIGGGYSEIFLHLQALADGLAEGVVLSAGDQVGFVGTTGRTSTSPHLHYQLNDESGNPIDPYIFYGSHRRSLSGADLAAFQERRDQCDIWMDGAASQ